jgi:hypothetical protein
MIHTKNIMLFWVVSAAMLRPLSNRKLALLNIDKSATPWKPGGGAQKTTVIACENAPSTRSI